jgi:hypothetical protein
MSNMKLVSLIASENRAQTIEIVKATAEVLEPLLWQLAQLRAELSQCEADVDRLKAASSLAGQGDDP